MSNSLPALNGSRKNGHQIGLSSTSNNASEDDGTLDLGALWTTITRHKWMILVTCLLITVSTGAYTWTLPKLYQAYSIVAVEVDPATNQVISLQAGSPKLASEIGVLENSGELSRRIVQSIRVHADSLEDVRFTLFEPEVEGQAVSEYTAIERLQERTAFEGDSEQGLIRITARSESPEEAALIANIFAEQYRAFSQEVAREGVVAARRFLEGQLQKRQQDIQDVEAEWESFAHNNAVATEGQDGQKVAQEYVELQSQRDALEFQLEQEERLLTVLQSQLETAEPDLRANVLVEQKTQSLRTQIQVLENEIATRKAEMEQYYINNPQLRGNEDSVPELAELKRQIDGFEARKVDLTEELVVATEEADVVMGDGTSTLGQIGTLREQIRAQELKIGQVESQIRGVNDRIANYQGRIQSIPRQVIQREQLSRRLTQAEQFYTGIANELQQTIVAEESELGYVKIMRSAVVPILPVSPNLQQNVILGLLLGLGLGVGGAFVRQSLNWTIYEPKDIQQQGYSLVGVIPTMDREIRNAFNKKKTIEVDGRQISTSLFPLLDPWSPITENYRLVRTNLQFGTSENGEARGPQVIMMTSPEPGDGKTTTAVNVAITTALSGREVLLIDADLRRPTSHKLLGLDRSPGLSDLFDGASEVRVVHKTIVDGLYLLPAGRPDVPPTELLDTEQFGEFLSLARERFDVVVIDTPPVLAVSDAVLIATHCDATLVVASANKTDFRALEQVKSTLGAVGVPISGIIYNRHDARKGNGSYYYGYDYTYDYSLTA